MAQNRSQYELKELLITSDRYPGEEIDLIGGAVELELYEHLDKPFITGKLLNVDNVAFRSAFGIQGTERINIKIHIPETGKTFERQFIITGIDKEVSINEKTQVRTLSFIEEHAYLSQLKKFSKVYESTPDGIISDIYASHLGKSVIQESFPPIQRRLRFINPYWTPMQAADFIRDRCTTDQGSPFFLYASLRTTDILFKDLEAMMETDAWNITTPYTFGHVAHHEASDGDAIQKAFFHVKAFGARQIDSTFKLAQAGSVGADYQIFDVTAGNFTSFHHSGADTSRRIAETVYPEAINESALNFDDTLEIGVDTDFYSNITQYPSKVISQVCQTQMFDGVQGYHDETDDANFHLLKLRSAAMKNILMNNVYTITVPGLPYFVREDCGVGTNIDLLYTLNTTDEANVSNIDEDKSGKFLIYKTKHTFSGGIHDCHMDIVKLSRKKQLP